MKISNLFVLRSIAGEHLLIPTGAAASSVQGLISMNETGALLYNKLSAGSTQAELIAALTAEYDVSREKALTDIDAFVATLKSVGCIEE